MEFLGCVCVGIVIAVICAAAENSARQQRERERMLDESIERLSSTEREMAKSLRATGKTNIAIDQTKVHKLDGAELIVTDTRHVELRRTS